MLLQLAHVKDFTTGFITIQTSEQYLLTVV